MKNLDFKYEELIAAIKKVAPFKPQIALVLGSGLGGFAKSIKTVKSIPTSSLPNYPKSTVQGHEGFIHFAEYKKKKLLLFQGRIHLYEGYHISKCILPSYISNKLGAEYLLLTNAAGGVNTNFIPGDLMLNISMNAINIKKELTDLFGIATIEQKNQLSDFPNANFNSIIINAALEENIHIKEGTYWFGKGPSYETPAEIRMAAKLGADAVGMSTVHEAVYGAACGMKVSAISLITNFAAGISPNKLSHQEVMETADLAKEKFERLVKRIITLL
ncbi:MAG: purine-nucleoside phosphorylase [Bacteroidetes bacterium]|nr:purine-nucleoside phosphorylase [Bacteroidota bacterium]